MWFDEKTKHIISVVKSRGSKWIRDSISKLNTQASKCSYWQPPTKQSDNTDNNIIKRVELRLI